jgi:thioesterase-3
MAPVIAQADLTFVLLDMQANKATVIDGEVRETLQALTLPKEAFST